MPSDSSSIACYRPIHVTVKQEDLAFKIQRTQAWRSKPLFMLSPDEIFSSVAQWQSRPVSPPLKLVS